jgi:hypothetical protein
MKCLAQYTFSEILELNYTSTSQRMKAGTIAALGVLMLGTAVWVGFTRSAEEDGPEVDVFFGVVFILLGLFAPFLAALGAWRRREKMASEELEFAEDGLMVRLAGEESLMPWTRFKKTYETQQLIVMLLAQHWFAWLRGTDPTCVIPKRCLSAEDLESVRALLKRKLPGRSSLEGEGSRLGSSERPSDSPHP